jgi:hypothetical protein
LFLPCPESEENNFSNLDINNQFSTCITGCFISCSLLVKILPTNGQAPVGRGVQQGGVGVGQQGIEQPDEKEVQDDSNFFCTILVYFRECCQIQSNPQI